MAACGAVGRGFKSLWARIDIDALYGFSKKQEVLQEVSESEFNLYSYGKFIFAMNAAQTRAKYSTRLGKFLRLVDVRGNTIQERCNTFFQIARTDNKSSLNNIAIVFKPL
jgi:hypothetical protein